MKIPILIIGGPTASGKSALALDLALHFNGVILNGDSLQIYKGLPILTAKPTLEAFAKVPHCLYNLFQEKEVCSVAQWQSLALDHINEASLRGNLPIVAGGTGMYLNSLIKGLSLIPEVSPSLRLRVRQDYETLGSFAFYERLIAKDPASSLLKPGDKQRCMRAWEVLLETGKPLSEWQKNLNRTALEPLKIETILLLPDREQLYAYSAERFGAMLRAGVIEEIKEFNQRHPAQSHSLAKAVGYRELSAYIEGKLSLEEACALAQQATRHYIKRQFTWFHNQVKEACVIKAIYGLNNKEDVFQKARSLVERLIKS